MRGRGILDDARGAPVLLGHLWATAITIHEGEHPPPWCAHAACVHLHDGIAEAIGALWWWRNLPSGDDDAWSPPQPTAAESTALAAHGFALARDIGNALGNGQWEWARKRARMLSADAYAAIVDGPPPALDAPLFVRAIELASAAQALAMTERVDGGGSPPSVPPAAALAQGERHAG